MDKRSLKLLSYLIVNEAKVTSERKTELIEAIKTADEKELVNFIKLNEELLHEIRPKTKTFFSNAGAMGYTFPIWAIYRKMKAKKDACTKKCGTYELNTIRRQVCMIRCNISSTQSMIGVLKKTKGNEEKIAKLQTKLVALQGKLRDYMAHGKKRGAEY